MTILVLRPSPAGEALVELLRQHKINACHTPLIEFGEGRELNRLQNKLSRLNAGDLLFVVSKQAVNYADKALSNAGADWPKNIRYFAIGRTSAEALSLATGCGVSYPKDREISEHLLELTELQRIEGKNALILRGNGGRALLAEQLSLRGANVEFCECYQRKEIHYEPDRLIALWRQREVKTIVATSTEIIKKLYALMDVQKKPNNGWLLNCRLIVVSERTALSARELGWNNIKIADNADNISLLAALK